MRAPPEKRNASPGSAGASDETVDIGTIEPSKDASPSRPKQGRVPRRSGLSSGERLHLHNREQAEKLAEAIRSFWKAKGRDVEVWCEQVHVAGGSEWVTRSAILPGVRRP